MTRFDARTHQPKSTVAYGSLRFGLMRHQLKRTNGMLPKPDNSECSRQTTESGGPRGYDAGKKTKGRKRHIVTDTDGNLLGLITHAADIQDRDGASVVIAQALENHSSLTHIFADGGYSGDKLRDAMASIDGPTIEIVKRPPGVTGFVVIARRWVVERTFAWLGRCRRLAKDWGKTIASADAWTLIAAIRRSARLIARKTTQEF